MNYDSPARLSEFAVAHNTKRAPKRSKVPAPKPSLAYGGAVHASIRNRWQSERPFLGHSESSLVRKLRSDAVLDYTKDLIYKELCSRGVIEIDAKMAGQISVRSSD